MNKRLRILSTLLRQPLPFNRQAEEGVLSCLLSRDATFNNSLVVEDFYFSHHRIIFEAIRALRERSVTVDLATLSAELERVGKLEEVGGRRELDTFFQSMVASDDAAGYVAIVRHTARLRNEMLSCHKTERRQRDTS
jgi:replicative DNA helicase